MAEGHLSAPRVSTTQGPGAQGPWPGPDTGPHPWPRALDRAHWANGENTRTCEPFLHLKKDKAKCLSLDLNAGFSNDQGEGEVEKCPTRTHTHTVRLASVCPSLVCTEVPKQHSFSLRGLELRGV